MVAYCRVSTKKDDQLNSLETQKLFFEEYAKKNNYNLVKIYADEGISGTKIKNRTQFLQMMADSQKGFFQIVAVKDISRLARNAVDFLQGIRQLKSNGIACNFVNASLTSQDSEMILGTLALVAQEESANTSKRIKSSKKMNAEKGRVPNFVFGYDKKNGDYFNLSINQNEADSIKKIFNMYINEGHGASKIAIILNIDGIKTKRGYKWTQNAIVRILTNEIYIGKVINGKEEIKDFLTGVRTVKDERDWLVSERKDLRIIDDETFAKAAKILAERCRAFNINHERQSNKHLFSTLIKCKDCGYSFRRRVRTYQNTYIDWICSGRNANGVDSCSNKTSIYEIDLIKAIQEYFANLLSDKPSVIKGIVSNFNKLYKAKDENVMMEKELKTKLKRLNKTRQKYMDMYEDDAITREQMREKMGSVNAQIEKITSGLKLIEYNLNKGNALESVLNSTFKDIENITSLETMTNTQIKRIIEKIVVDDNEKVDIYLKLFADIGLDNSVLISDNRT